MMGYLAVESFATRLILPRTNVRKCYHWILYFIIKDILLLLTICESVHFAKCAARFG